VHQEEVRHCDPVSLIVYEDTVYHRMTGELKESLESEFVSTSQSTVDDAASSETVTNMEKSTVSNLTRISEI